LIETHATSRVRLPNTVVDVAVEISASGKDMVTVQRALAANSDAFLQYLRGLQVDRLITTSVSFAPETRYEKSGPDKAVGYNGTAEVSFRTTPAKVAEVLGGVLGHGANRIGSTRFTPSEAEIAKARRELAADATRSALAQADSIAAAAGMKVAAIRKIDMSEVGGAGERGMFEVNGLSAYKAKSPQSMPVGTAAGEAELGMQIDVVAAALP
jgi:uncharacterized protein YggE